MFLRVGVWFIRTERSLRGFLQRGNSSVWMVCRGSPGLQLRVQKSLCVFFPQGGNLSVSIVYRCSPSGNLVFNFQLLDELESLRCTLAEKKTCF